MFKLQIAMQQFILLLNPTQTTINPHSVLNLIIIYWILIMCQTLRQTMWESENQAQSLFIK